MADDNSFGGGLQAFGSAVGNLFSGGASAPPADPGGDNGTDVLPTAAQPTEGRTPSGGFGSGIGSFGPPSYESKPGADPLDAAANMLQQRIDRAQQVGSNPLLQIMNPEGALAARNFVPQATEQLLKIKQQKATISANRQEATNLGLAPGEVADEATQAERVTVAKDRALQGNLTVFKGLQAVDPKSAEAIAPQVMEVVGSHLTKAQYAYDKLSNMRNQGEYDAALSSLRKEGALTDLEALGLKVPGDYGTFTKAKAVEGQALREARMSVNDLRTKLEERNTYQPMDKKEAETYNGRLTTAYGDQVTNGSWARRGSDGKRALVVNGMSDPRELGKSFTLATPEQRKAVSDEFKAAVPTADIEKDRAFNRIYKIATTDRDGKPLPANQINTNPNVQQGVAEGLAAALRGGNGGANTGLLNIETSKRGVVQGVLDSISSGYAGAINTISEKDVRPYLTKLTQSQIRDVMDAIHSANSNLLNDRVGSIAERAGALGLDATAFGLGKDEANGAIGAALERGRTAQVQRMMPYHQAIGGGDGALAIGAQAVGQDATPLPPGATPRTQQPVGTPAQRTLPPGQPASPPNPPVPGGGGAPPAMPGQPTPPSGNSVPPAAGGGAQPVQVAGQQVSVPLPQGASPSYVASLQRIESGKERDPWTAGAKGSSASGAFQFINSTWRDNKPAGAPPRAADATPAQQAEALASLTTKNAAALSRSGVPVDDTNLYIAHNVGAGGAAGLLHADPNADARSVVGEDAAKNNPLFFKGKPTVATVLGRYQAEMAKDIDASVPRGTPPLPGAAKPAGDQPSLMTRISRTLMQGVPENERDASVARVGDAATDNAPAIGSTIGALGGSVGGPVGAVAGGGAGGAAGQAVKDWLQGRDQSPRAIAKEGALGAVLGVGGAARPLLGAAARTAGAAAVEGGDAALQGKEGADITDAAVHGAATGAVGEAFGRALGMAGHKLWSMFAPDAQKAVQAAASKYADAEKVLASEVPKLPGPGGTGAVSNPKYEAAEKAKAEAETVLKDVGIKPEEAAYAHKVASEGVPKQEAQVSKPGALEKDDIGKGYGQLENEVADAGKGALKPTPKLPDGPIAAVEKKQVSERHAELAQRIEATITAPAPDWRTKWTQLKDARSDLLQAERDALSSTAPGRTQIAKDMRELADTVRVQQDKAAKYVFGEKDGAEFMKRLKVLDTRYRNLMDATNGGDIAKAAALKGEAGREAEKKFVAFAHDDKDAIAAYRAMRGVKGDLAEATVPWTVAAEGLPIIGKGVKVVKLGGILREWARERAAGSPASFADIVRLQNTGESARMARDVAGTAVQRGAVMQDQQQQ